MPSDQNIFDERVRVTVTNLRNFASTKCAGPDDLLNNPKMESLLRSAVMPSLEAYDQEKADALRQRDFHSKDAEAKRFALEFIVSNLGGSVQITEPAIVDAIKKALPGRLP